MGSAGMQNESTSYTPIACGFHDRLEHWAIRQDIVTVVWMENDKQRSAEDRITDVFAESGADYIKLGSGETIRLDFLVSVDGIDVPNVC